jgi:kinesin family protein 14
VVDLLTLSASSAQDAKLWLDIGNKRRATACTNMNQKSSRSHSVFQITLTQMLEQKSAVNNSNGGGSGEQKLLQLVTSRINLVDLAGSERINSSFNNSNSTSDSLNSNRAANAGSSSSSSSSNQLTQSRLKESTCINKSLLTLGKIICLLSERQTVPSSNPLASTNTNSQNAAILVNASANAGSSTNIHLPYRDSVLTWLLKESLGGNAKTAMLATVCASSAYIDETVCTLRYAAKTACIKTTAHLNRNYRRQYIDEFGRESEMTLILPPMSAIDNSYNCCTGNCATKKVNSDSDSSSSMEATIKTMEAEWREKLARAECLKQKEIADLEKSLIVLYANETRSHNCCLINLNEDPSLSEKLIYLLKNDEAAGPGDSVTIIGSDKARVDIHLSGALLSGQHAKITKNNASNEHFIEQLDESYLTFVNGDVLNHRQKVRLMHGDRIIFGGSHFFRFNNPLSIAEKPGSGNKKGGITVTSMDSSNQFKDYQFAKNEIERKQNEIMQAKLSEAVSKCKQDGDLRLVEITREYEKNIEKIVIFFTVN